MRGWMSAAVAACVVLAAGAASAQQGRRDRPEEGTLKVGDAAPDFKLKKLEPETKKDAGAKKAGEKKPEPVTLSDFKGKKPVVLIFGSYT